jgi:hypothetical protein
MPQNTWDPRDAMLRRLGVAAAVCEVVALGVAGLLYLGQNVGSWSMDLSLSAAFNVGWAVFVLAFVPSCLWYVRRNETQLNGDRCVRIAEALLDGRRTILLRARSRRK